MTVTRIDRSPNLKNLKGFGMQPTKWLTDRKVTVAAGVTAAATQAQLKRGQEKSRIEERSG